MNAPQMRRRGVRAARIMGADWRSRLVAPIGGSNPRNTETNGYAIPNNTGINTVYIILLVIWLGDNYN